MVKFVFSEKQKGETIYLDRDEGNYDFPNCAEIKYAIDREDKDVKITIDDFYFDLENLDILIEFLQAMRKEIA